MEVPLQCQIHPYEYFFHVGDPASHIIAQFTAPEPFDPEGKIR
jgi:hypothetical protein